MALEEQSEQYFNQEEVELLKERVLGRYGDYTRKEVSDLFGGEVPEAIIDEEVKRIHEERTNSLTVTVTHSKPSRTEVNIRQGNYPIPDKELEKLMGEYVIGYDIDDDPGAERKRIIVGYHVRRLFFSRHCGERMFKINPVVREESPLKKPREHLIAFSMLFCPVCGGKEDVTPDMFD